MSGERRSRVRGPHAQVSRSIRGGGYDPFSMGTSTRFPHSVQEPS
jgi:hypothetical protein